MKRSKVFFLLTAMITGLLTGCSGAASGSESAQNGQAEGTEAEGTELIIFAAASLTETLTQLGDTYSMEHPKVTLVFNFDSSGTLKTQIQEGAECDIFISAGQKQMDQLDISADPEVNTEGLDFVQEDTRLDILENKSKRWPCRRTILQGLRPMRS